jgi:hypothetical protein
MSGLKYKKCCLKRESILKKIPCQTYSESYVLQNLLDKSPQFKSFYEAERAKITRNIIWAYDPDLGSNVRATFLQGIQENLIVFHSLPLKAEDALDIAHEMTHFICNEEGYPSVSLTKVGIVQESANVATALTSSFSDPIVTKRLLPFGFDLWAQYDQASAREKAFFEKTEEPAKVLDSLYYTAYYISKALQWDACCLSSPREANDYLLWYDSHYPRFTSDARKTLAWIKDQGYETPDQAEAALDKLLTQFEQEKAFEIKRYPVGH